VGVVKLVSYGGRLKPLTALSPWMTVLLAGFYFGLIVPNCKKETI